MTAVVVHEFDSPDETAGGVAAGTSTRVVVVEEDGRFRFTDRDLRGDLNPGKLLLSGGAAAEIARLVRANRGLRERVRVENVDPLMRRPGGRA